MLQTFIPKMVFKPCQTIVQRPYCLGTAEKQRSPPSCRLILHAQEELVPFVSSAIAVSQNSDVHGRL